MRISRWSRQPKLVDGQPEPFEFVASDYELCKFFAHNIQVRHPWPYRYLPTKYILALMGRGHSGGKKRLAELFEQSYLNHPPQPINNFRDIIYSIGPKGTAALREGGYTVPIPSSGRMPHDLKACLVAASFEYGARKHGLNITPDIRRPDKLYPDWPPFLFQGHEIYLEADMGSETIKRSKNKDATTIGGKYEEYLSHIANGRLKNPLILFITKDTDDSQRIENMIEELKAVIDARRYPNPYPYSYAQHFAFTYLGPDRFINSIPPISDWAVSQDWKRVGKLPPLNFLAQS